MRNYYYLLGLAISVAFVACNSSHNGNAQSAVITSFGNETSSCQYQAYEIKMVDTAVKSYGIYKYLDEENRFELQKKDWNRFGRYGELAAPTISADISGNFDGFGKRKIHDDSANRSYIVNVVYHASGMEGIYQQMKALGCY